MEETLPLALCAFDVSVNWWYAHQAVWLPVLFQDLQLCLEVEHGYHVHTYNQFTLALPGHNIVVGRGKVGLGATILHSLLPCLVVNIRKGPVAL